MVSSGKPPEAPFLFIKEVFMENIRTFRVLRKMSQWELAQTTGIVQSKISLFERGYIRPSFEELKRLAEALNVDTEKLIIPISIEVRAREENG
jgi:transcriptional regulator with XRE-family HTH domain